MTVRDARADELSVELLAPCEGSSVSRDHRVTIRAPFGRIGVQSLPIVHPFIALPVEVWGPPGTRAHVRLRFERPGEDVDLDVGPPIELTFDGSGICGIAASLERLWLRSEGVHAVAVLAGDRVLARRRITVVRIPEWDWPKNEGVRSRVVDGGGGTKSGVPWCPCANEGHQTPRRGAGVRRVQKGTEPTGQAPATLVVRDVLTELARAGARKMLAQALEDEVAAYVAAAVEERDDEGHRLVVRNGHARERAVQTGVGPVPVRAPRVRDGRKDEAGEPVRFTSKILPPYLRKTRSVEELLPWLYLQGVSTNGFQDALSAIFGPDAPGLSSRTIVRLKEVWEEEYEAWTRRSLGTKRYVYLWVDGVHVNVRLTGERTCILVVIGATKDGEKELLAVHDGVRESEESWKDVLLSLRDRGVTNAPQLAVGDGALGFWAALPKVFPTTRTQRCWVHKTANVLNKLPKKLHPEAKRRLHEIWMAESRDDAVRAVGSFGELFGAKYPKAFECIAKDKDALLAFYDFPAEHWKHLRTSNPIESTFSTVRLRTDRTKGAGSRIACLTMVFKLCQSAARSWRRLDAVERLGDLVLGVRFKDGIKVAA